MGSLYLNGETFGGDFTIFGTSEPTANIGEEGNIYMLLDNKNIAFKGEYTSNKFAEPLTVPLDMTTFQTGHVEYKERGTSYKKDFSISDFIHDPSIVLNEDFYQASTYVYVTYQPSNPTYLSVHTETNITTTVYLLTSEHSDIQRIKTIYGKHNGVWFPYQVD